MTKQERKQLKTISRRVEKLPMICKKCGGVLVIMDMSSKHKPAEVKKLERIYNIQGYCECLKCGAYYLAMNLDK